MKNNYLPIKEMKNNYSISPESYNFEPIEIMIKKVFRLHTLHLLALGWVKKKIVGLLVGQPNEISILFPAILANY